MAQLVTCVIGGTQADHRGILLHKGILRKILRQIAKHLALGVGISAEAEQAIRLTKQQPGQFQLPGREKAGIGRHIPQDAGVDLVPNLGQKHSVIGGLGYFFNILSIHRNRLQTY